MRLLEQFSRANAFCIGKLGAERRKMGSVPIYAMAKLDLWASEHEFPPDSVVLMEQAVIAPLSDMERKGDLD